MHNNYYFLRQLSAALKPRLLGFEIISCFSQEKDELVISLSNGRTDFFIKAILASQFSTLSFPAAFNRARQNSVSLFPEIIGKKVLNVIQNQNERSFYLKLEDNLALLFKMFGNRSNIVLFTGDEATNLFQKKFEKDLSLRLSGLDRQLQTDKTNFLETLPPLQKLYPTFGDVPAKYSEAKGYAHAQPDVKWQILEETRQLMENPVYYIITLDGRIRLSLLQIGEIRATFYKPIEALQEFVRLYLTEGSFEKKYQQVHQQLHKKLEGSRRFLEQVEYKILELEYDNSFSQTADLIMANLTNILVNATEVKVFDFYNNTPVIIKLPLHESPQKFAERLYRKNKNRQIEIKYLIERAEAKRNEITRLEQLLQKLSVINTSRELKIFLKENELQLTEQKEENQNPCRVFEADGFKILVGKNAKNNDLLTQQHTFKEDLWLHAKDVAGSHVVIKYQAGKIFPESIIEKAAQLAAWYSKRKNDSLCPVLYTPKKFVRKPKGAAPGEVIVEREKVILVKPANPFSQRIM